MLHFIFKELSYLLLKCAFSVQNLLGPGLLESAYEGAFCVELAKAGISFERQKVYPLYYKGEIYWRKTPSFSSQKSTYVDFCKGLILQTLL